MWESSKVYPPLVPLARLDKLQKVDIRENWESQAISIHIRHIRPRKKISKRSLEIITQRQKISSRLQSLFFQGIQECPVPATLPSCSAWTWYFRKPNTSGSLSIRVVVLTTFTNKCCVKPSQVWDIGWRFLFSEIHSGPCLTAGCSALALWLRPSRLELQSYFFDHHPTIFTKGGRLLWASSLQTEEHQRE